LPAPFVLTKSGETAKGTTFQITNNLSITTQSVVYSLKWDSKTGLVSGLSSSEADEATRKPVLVTGNTVGGIPAGGCTLSINGATLKYHYWYY
jgi:hypothetical protein